MTSRLISTPTNLNSQKLPQHIAIIMDGNGRWAKKQGLPRIVGHRKGAENLKQILGYCKNWGINILTVYAFSTENWGRPKVEVEFLMNLFENMLDRELQEMHSQGVRITFLGNITSLPLSLQKLVEGAMAETIGNREISFNVAINYGSRQEITRACRNLAAMVKEGKLEPDAIDENTLQKSLYTANLPDPDLLIRTSGEMRLSNFLLWQLAYTELYLTDTLWPDFTGEEFRLALIAYQKRERRFGKV